MRIIVDTKENIDSAVAKRIEEIIVSKEKPVLGFATGSSPLGVYDILVQDCLNKKISFQNVTTFNLDEYVGIAPSHPQSYRYFMNEHLFSKVDILLSNTFVPTRETYSSYDAMIQSEGGLDFQLLGIGSDGHIGFNEPGVSFSSLTHIVELKESTRKDNSRFFSSLEEVPRYSMTMGPASILNAREIILIACGRKKADAVKGMIEGPVDESCPASVLQRHPNVTVYLDKEAASGLTQK